ncbi:MAG: SRPBCC family protein [Opitutaceae bacterium]|nr:SRPBCC family protein [Opitutaceae bacterium]
MKWLFWIQVGLIGLLAVLVVIGFLLPRSYRVERSLTFRAAPEVVFSKLNDLTAWREWGGWYERDPGMKLSYSHPAAGVGAWSEWTTAGGGRGRLTITGSQPPARLEYNLSFPEWRMESRGLLTLTPAAGGCVTVAWTAEGDLGGNPFSRWFGPFMDRILGPDFENSLAKLRRLTEK